MITDEVAILCVDDNPLVADALRIKFGRVEGFRWAGWLPSADDLVPTAMGECPGVVILDVDMPGRDAFEAVAELAERCPEARVIMFSGHVRQDLVDRAVEAGAWGYASKNDGEDALLEAIRNILAGEFALTPEVRETYGR